MRLSAQRATWRRQTEFYLVEERSVPDWSYKQPHLLQPSGQDGMEWARQQEGFCDASPSFCLTDEATQELFDMLWAGGYRPRGAINEASRIEAVTKHLEDMRTIAFEKLKIAAPSGTQR